MTLGMTVLRRLKPVVLSALVAMLYIGLASCSGGPVAGGAVRANHSDLVVESPTVNDARPAAGASFTFSATVRNSGGADTADTTLRVYRSDDATITPGDEEVGTITTAEPAASRSVASVTLRAPTDAGTYYYGVCVTAADGESGTADSCSASVRVTVLEAPVTTQEQPTTTQEQPTTGLEQPTTGPEPQGPDLVVDDVSVSEGSLVTAQTLRVATTVRNIGNKGAAATLAILHPSTDSTITPSDDGVYWERISGLAPSGSKFVRDNLAAPAAPGTYYYGACVTAVDGESDTTNNCSATPTRVTVRRAPTTDLVITSPYVRPINPAAGGVLSIHATLRNAGERTDGTEFRYFRSDDATFTSSDPEVHKYWWGPFSSLSTSDVSSTLDVPTTLGTYYYRVCADAVTGESNTTNNCSAAVKVVVSHSKPNLRFSQWGVQDWTGASFPIHATVKNVGGASAATTLRFYQSSDKTFTASDTEIHAVPVGPLAKTESRTPPVFHSGKVAVTPPATGTYYYGACVDAVDNESDTTDNCTRVIHTIRR
ncbi:MAG: hypothetical protein OXP69_18690 [Spirochaetaceae bacterium]|nr:hypothetical protein [Spirochaetaceae bacterium]